MKFNLKKMLITGAIIYGSVVGLIMLISGFFPGIMSMQIVQHVLGITLTGFAARQIVPKLYAKAYTGGK